MKFILKIAVETYGNIYSSETFATVADALIYAESFQGNLDGVEVISVETH